MIILILLFLLSVGFFPEVLSQYPVPDFDKMNGTYSSYNGQIVCSTNYTIQQPTSIGAVAFMMYTAQRKKLRVKAFGSLHSIMDTVCTDGVAIAMHFMNKSRLNPDKTVTVEAGAKLDTVLDFLHTKNLTIEHVPCFACISVGGAIGSGAHGTSLNHPTALSDYVKELKMVNGDGYIKTINNEEELKAFKVHLGLLGVIVEVTLKTVPLYKVKMINYQTSDEILTNGKAIEMARKYDWFQMFWFPSRKSVIVSNGTNIYDLNEPGNATTNFVPNIERSQARLFKDLMETSQVLESNVILGAIERFTERSLHKETPGRPHIFQEKGKFVNPAVGFGHRMMANRCEKCVWNYGNDSFHVEEYAFALDIMELPSAIKSIRNILEKFPTRFPLIGIQIRFSPKTSTHLAIENGRETVHIDWTNPMRSDPYKDPKLGLATFQAMSQALVSKHGARAHWGKSGPVFHSRNLMQREFLGGISKFKEVSNKYYGEIFLNRFGERLFGTNDSYTINPKVTHCALQDNCICSKNSDCAERQTCENYQDYKVCVSPTVNLIGKVTEALITRINDFSTLVTTILNLLKLPILLK